MTTTATRTTRASFRDGVNRALDDAMASDRRVIVFGEDVADREGGGVLTVTKGLSEKYGTSRVRSTPISEQAIVGAAVGAAIAGARPVAEIMLNNFLRVAADQLANHAAKLRYMSGGQTTVPLTVRTICGAAGGFGAQHSDILDSEFAHVAGLKIVAPATPSDAYGLLRSCIEDEDPCLFLEHLKLYFGGPKEVLADVPERIPLGSARIARAGTDVTVVTYSQTVHDALAAAKAVAADGIDVEVIDLRTIAPWDEQTVLESAARTRRIVVAHESAVPFGIGGEISSRIHEELFSQLAGPVLRVGSAHTPVPFAAALESAYLINASTIETAIRKATKA
ncbi:acetoin dehydrogenase E1 component (TPP-dependent beta subunit) [Frankia canadensis]|uniref:Acetoin dehydrogenase E1 component (TPP-dependent beta subunit) n=1 Tax=Frankia canadensis TaxID=1836972 RepID=A0A2I2KJF1_9ACTN|nr:transketolase C-terminal domain-containing protein [Frankia canadensis]SNQ45802.1 acetoin dehydrogenase E1 component (TPP-dependent beta subunit) [Frankia canadensis]SOU53092.1 acetoin dehydrogenase E1 component (TPP-dependent beta subunit) [Frankia canadensis]